MLSLFGGQKFSEQNEKLLLIAEAIKAGIPLAEAIRLTVLDDRQEDQPFIRFAELLDRGVLPQLAVDQAGFLPEIKVAFANSFHESHFADAFAIQANIAHSKRQLFLRVCHPLVYPFWLLTIAGVLLHLFAFILVPHFERIFLDFDTSLPLMTMGVLELARIINSGGLVMVGILFFLLLYLLQQTVFPRFFYTVPIFGPIALRQFQRTLFQVIAFSLKRAVPLHETLIFCQRLTRNRAFRQDLRQAAAAAQAGQSSLELIVRFPWLFPAWLGVDLFACPEPHQQADAFERAATVHDSQIDASLVVLQSSTLVFSLSVIILGTGISVMSLLLPMIKLVSSLSN